MKRRTNGSICRTTADLSSKIILVTGGNKGIGKEVVKILAQLRGRIIIAARDKKSSLDTIDEIKKNRNDLFIEYMHLDLSKTESIITFSSKFKEKCQNLHILINNAGKINLIDFY